MNFFGYSIEIKIKKNKKNNAENIFNEIEDYFEDNYENNWIYYRTSRKIFEKIKQLAEMDYYRNREDEDKKEKKSYYEFVVSEENRFTNKVHFKVKLKGNSG